MVLPFARSRAGIVAEMVLNGERIFLRLPIERDYPAWVEIRELSRAFLTPWEPSWPADGLTRESFRRRVRRFQRNWSNDAGYSFFIFRQADHALLGGVNLAHLRRGATQTATLGYWMGAPYAGQGYMREAVQLLFAFAFDTVALHRLEAACLPHNERSRRLLHGLGFREEGFARKYLCIDGVWQDHILFGLLAEEWRVNCWGAKAPGRPTAPLSSESHPTG